MTEKSRLGCLSLLAAIFVGCADPVGVCPVDGQLACFTRAESGACVLGARICDGQGRGIGPCVAEDEEVALEQCLPSSEGELCADQVGKVQGDVRVLFDEGQRASGFTAGAWVLPTALVPDSEDGVLLYGTSGEQGGFSLQLVADGSPPDLALEFRYGETCTVRVPNSVPLDRWTHVAISFAPDEDSGIVTALLFINGLSTSFTECSIEVSWQGNGKTFLGARPAGISGYAAASSFVGYVDDVFIEQRAVDSSFSIGPDYLCADQARSVIDFAAGVGPSGCGLGAAISVVEGSASPELTTLSLCQPSSEVP